MPPASLPFTPELQRHLAAWLDEDLGRGDLTTPALAVATGRAHWIASATPHTQPARPMAVPLTSRRVVQISQV